MVWSSRVLWSISPLLDALVINKLLLWVKSVFMRLVNGKTPYIPLYIFFIPFYSDVLIILSSFLQGDAKNTFGTGAFMLFNTGDEPLVSQNGMVTTVGFQFGKNKPAYALEGSIASAGSAIKWTRDNLGLISSSEEIGPLGKQRNELCL